MKELNSIQPQTNKGLKTKRKIMNAAEFVIAKRGYFEASITEITQQAGVSLGTFYTYFESKYQIFEELLFYSQKKMRDYIRQKTSGLSSRKEIEREGFRAYLQFLKENPDSYQLYRQAQFVNEELFIKYIESFMSSYISNLNRAMNKNEIREVNTEILAYAITGMLDRIGLKWIIWGKQDLEEQIIDEIMDILSGVFK